MAGFLLTDAERQRFLQWLELQAESSRAMLKQFESLPSNVAEAMSRREKQELAGYLIVANVLRSSESMTISGENNQ
jgi:hypothetical protein